MREAMKGSAGLESQPAAASGGNRQAQIGNRKERFSATMRVSRVGSPTYPVVYPFMPVVAMPSMK